MVTEVVVGVSVGEEVVVEEEALVTEVVEAVEADSVAEEEDSGEEEEAVVVSGRQVVRGASVVVEEEDGAEDLEVGVGLAASEAERGSWWSPTDMRVCLFAVGRKMPWLQGTW